MSEHTELECNNIQYLHLPYQEEGFSYCKRCKRFVKKASIIFHEGWFSEWCEFRCNHCNHAIWIVEFKPDPKKNIFVNQKKLRKMNKEDLKLEYVGVREFIKDDKKCSICKKPTNHYDCKYVCYGGRFGKKGNYVCSRKCAKIDSKLDRKWMEKQKYDK